MTADLKSTLVSSVQAAADQAGLVLVSATEGSDFHGQPTAVFQLGLPGSEAAGRTLKLELSEAFEFNKPDLLPAMTAHLAAEAKRLRNPRPECYVTLGGLPVALGQFQWPFHTSISGADTHIVHGEMHLAGEAKRLRNPRPECYVTLGGLPVALGQFQWPFHTSISGADTHIVHGEMHLADGGAHNLHAKIAASVTLTFAEIVPAMEQPYAESFVYNAVRKTVDLGQLEFIKSGNRQPVPVTTRYYSRWQKKFLFTETNDAERLEYLLRKVYWLSGVLGEGKPVWIADPRDAQYLNTTEEDLLRIAGNEAGEGLMALDGEFAAATPKLMERAPEYQATLDAALNFTKPQFNESMRSGHANM
jgi:hypothetical protein